MHFMYAAQMIFLLNVYILIIESMFYFVGKTENEIQMLETNFEQSGQRFTKRVLKSSILNILKLKCFDFEDEKN